MMCPPLSRALLRSYAWLGANDLATPPESLFALPEKVVQFGTGAFLRGFIGALIDDANQQERFGGRVVAVASTESARTRQINDQDGLYTLAVQGLRGGEPYRNERIIGSISRALTAAHEWDKVLACARQPALELIVCNTTDAGIVLDEGDRPELNPPRSFPGKLTRFLFERARCFDYAPARGMVILPCELIEKNGDRLRTLVLETAHRWQLGHAFSQWLDHAVPFCNTLVDRIVPGVPGPPDAGRFAQSLGYCDALLTVCEPYLLFAIEADERARSRLPFSGDEPGIVFADDISAFRERKVGLLNGTHTLMVPVALACGCNTVSEAVSHDLVAAFVRQLMFEEIAPTLDAPDADSFARETLGRFGNPFIRHSLTDIALQATTKFRVRVVPLIERFMSRTGMVPGALAFGMAAQLYSLHPSQRSAMTRLGLDFPPDDEGARIDALWRSAAEGAEGVRAVASAACSDARLWGRDLTQLAGFQEAVADALIRMMRVGVPMALESLIAASTDPGVPRS
jgi:tagaturonate reductase